MAKGRVREHEVGGGAGRPSGRRSASPPGRKRDGARGDDRGGRSVEEEDDEDDGEVPLSRAALAAVVRSDIDSRLASASPPR